MVREKGGKTETIFDKGPIEQTTVTRTYPGAAEDFSFDLAYASSVPSTENVFDNL